MNAHWNLATSSWRRAALLALLLGIAPGCSMLERLPPLPTAENRRKEEQQKLSLARLSEDRGNPSDAKHIYEQLVLKNPQHQEAHRRLGVIATREGRFADADRHFHQAWQIGPQSAGLLTDMGYRLYLEHRLTEAEELLRQAVTLEPQNATANNNLGLVLGQQNRMDEAMQCFLRVNREAEAHANLAYVLTQVGRIEEAKIEFSKSLSKDKGMRSSATGLLALSGAWREMPPHIPPPSQPQPPSMHSPSAPIVAGAWPSAAPPHMNASPYGQPVASWGPQNQLPPWQTTAAPGVFQAPVNTWQPVAVTESQAPLNPQPPSLAPNWQGPPPAIAANHTGYAPGPAQPSGYVQPASYTAQGAPAAMQTTYQGPPAPYGGMHAGSRMTSSSTPQAIPMQYSNGIPPQAGPAGSLPMGNY